MRRASYLSMLFALLVPAAFADTLRFTWSAHSFEMGGITEGLPLVGLESLGSSRWDVGDMIPQDGARFRSGMEVLDGAGFALTMQLDLSRPGSREGQLRVLLDGLDLALYELSKVGPGPLDVTWFVPGVAGGTLFHTAEVRYSVPPAQQLSAQVYNALPALPQAIVWQVYEPIVEVPEPGSMALVAAGAALLARRWRKRHR